ncbi:MAG: YkgJ family cysteine cluster protein [Candidatus Gastranaerophilaceae bacterium]
MFSKLSDIVKSMIYEILSYFVPERQTYKITGHCKQCGKCCNYMYSKDTYSEKEFKIMQFFNPAYRRFYIKGKDEEGNLIFACKDVTADGKCSVYKRRPRVCRNYPAKILTFPVILHEGCGYKVEEKKFEDYLK